MDAHYTELRDAYRAMARSVDTYERTWWLQRVEPQLSFLQTRPTLRTELTARLLSNQATHTSHVYADPDGVWAAERVAVQDALLSGLVAGSEASSGNRETGSDEPALARGVYFLIGLPGSGKTTSLRPLVHRYAGVPEEAVPVSDADDVRVRLPEYLGGLGSGVVQTEVAFLTYGPLPGRGLSLQERVLAGGVCIVDVIGDVEFLPETVAELTRQGRDCYVLLADCPVEACAERVMQRALDVGRFVPVELVQAKEGVPRAALEALIKRGDLRGWVVVDTTATPETVTDGDGDLYASLCLRGPG